MSPLAREVSCAFSSDSEEPVVRKLRSPSFGALAKAGFSICVGFALGYASHSCFTVRRLPGPPVPPLNVSSGGTVQLQAVLDDGVYPPPFLIGNNRVCGAARCTPGDLCCPSAPGYGFACGRTNAVCCQGNRGTVVCAEAGTCCRNRHGAAYCCAQGNQCQSDVCVAGNGGSQCFPGHASVTLEGGVKAVEALAVGDRVLVEEYPSVFSYQPVLDFLHANPDDTSDFLTIIHAAGQFRASANHMVFTTNTQGHRRSKAAFDIEVGDGLFIAGHSDLVAVLCVKRAQTAAGMFAPLTASGTIVVDGASASTYAVGASDASVTHAPMHASFFLTRIVYSCRLPGDAVASGVQSLLLLLLAACLLDSVMRRK
eukprot:TRINITY_DN24822_c0_g1_i1.p1 TRINITY_DN24822_c0_g1~~TRINITY_DN24822_c0_g1_i1.p1  ORF type:complete len:393 (-),score=22.66 TRINITY_DN24822_c0_g1_i1:246-1352(-)